jgi:hypothetical protein
MSQRHSGYARKPLDRYETPAWVTDLVVDFLGIDEPVWEPACGTGKMVSALRDRGISVYASDIESGEDFLQAAEMPAGCKTVVTNPPFNLAQDFIECALRLTKPVEGVVAMLLRADFDHAKTRRHLFGDCVAFRAKLALTKRIRWFADSIGSPSINHCWLIWDWRHVGPPTIAYAPSNQQEEARAQSQQQT